MNNLTEFSNFLILNNCPSGVINYLPVIKDFLNEYTEITEECINKFLVKKKESGLSDGYLNIFINAIRSYCKFINLKIRLPKYFKTIQKLPVYISLEFFETVIIKDLPEIFTPKKAKQAEIILYFLFFSGLRKSELLTLKKEDFNFKEAECKIYVKKTKTERLIPLTERIMKMVISYSYDHPSENNIFGATKSQIDYICQKIAENYKIKLSAHTFRHSYAMYMKKLGFDILDIQLLLGHQNINSTMRYAKADIKEIKGKFRKRVK
jgi:integrase/recombinase XerD